MKFKGIGHIEIRVRDLQQAIDYYTRVLEAEVCGTEAGKAVLGIGQKGQKIILVQADPAVYVSDNRKCGRSHFHCCLEIDARHEAYRDMARKNIPIEHTPEDTVGMCGSWCSFITDPEGNEWELMEFSPASLQIAGDAHNLRFCGQ